MFGAPPATAATAVGGAGKRETASELTANQLLRLPILHCLNPDFVFQQTRSEVDSNNKDLDEDDEGEAGGIGTLLSTVIEESKTEHLLSGFGSISANSESRVIIER